MEDTDRSTEAERASRATSDPGRRSWGAAAGLLGAACAACCVSLVVVAVGGLGAVTAAVTSLIWPFAGLLVAVATVIAVVVLRSRKPRSCEMPEATSGGDEEP